MQDRILRLVPRPQPQAKSVILPRAGKPTQADKARQAEQKLTDFANQLYMQQAQHIESLMSDEVKERIKAGEKHSLIRGPQYTLQSDDGLHFRFWQHVEVIADDMLEARQAEVEADPSILKPVIEPGWNLA